MKSEGIFRKILVPVDGSENSEKALQYAVVLARKTNAEMTLLYVQESSLFRLRPEVSKEIELASSLRPQIELKE